jgi:hypothetical protein
MGGLAGTPIRVHRLSVSLAVFGGDSIGSALAADAIDYGLLQESRKPLGVAIRKGIKNVTFEKV